MVPEIGERRGEARDSGGNRATRSDYAKINSDYRD